MYAKLDQQAISLLCCPLCKSSLEFSSQGLYCMNCASRYPLRRAGEEKVFDFRIQKPEYCSPEASSKWADVQKSWEDCYFERYIKHDNFDDYLKEIDSVKEVYAKEFDMKGKVLDVGGGEGTLRHFILPDGGDSLYVSIDPTINVFDNLSGRRNLLKAFPSLSKPCNFLAACAENLPFASNTFDWAHIRSVLDHFQDPYLAIKEIYRVLKPGGSLLCGVTVYGGKSSMQAKENLFSRAAYKLKIDGPKAFFEAAAKKIFKVKGWETIHTFEWGYDNLANLLETANFKIIKEHWQKPPFTMVVWMQAEK